MTAASGKQFNDAFLGGKCIADSGLRLIGVPDTCILRADGILMPETILTSLHRVAGES